MMIYLLFLFLVERKKHVRIEQKIIKEKKEHMHVHYKLNKRKSYISVVALKRWSLRQVWL